MQAFADFTDSLLGGLRLVCLATALGALPWALVVLRAPARAAGDPFVRRCVTLMAAGAVGLALTRAGTLALKAMMLASYLGPRAYADFAATQQFRAGAAQAALALLLAAVALWLRRAPERTGRWVAAGALATALAASGAWLVHAASRLEHAPTLMALTVVHQVAAAVWAGGLIQLAAAARGDWAAWRGLVARFSAVAIAAVAVASLSASALTWAYVGSWAGLVGSGYGSIIVTKVGLMAAALAIGGLNFIAGRRIRRGAADAALGRRTAPLLEVEALLLCIVLFAAAGLSAQPPPIDTPGEQASWREVVEVFRPKWPALITPSVATMIDEDARAIEGAARTAAAYSWSNFSHNVAGLFLLGMSALALAAERWPRSPARHWPLAFVALGVFVFLRTSANDGIWPFGPFSIWRTMIGDAEVLQHRLGAGLAVLIGVLEWRARTREAAGSRGAYLFPALAAAGGLLLLTHSHAPFELKSSYLVQVTHTVMGALAVLLACGRLLELRLAPPASRVAGTLASVAMLLIALVLVFYQEANVVPDDSTAGRSPEAAVVSGGHG